MNAVCPKCNHSIFDHSDDIGCDTKGCQCNSGFEDVVSLVLSSYEAELAAWKELYNEAASNLNYNNHLLSQIQDVLNKKITGSKVCNHYFENGACVHCGVTIAQFTTRA